MRRFDGVAAACAAAMLAACAAHASLATSGFRAVAVARTGGPVSAIATAPDGRLFVAVQTTGQTSGTTPGQAEIRVYTDFATSDGAILDAGTSWATVDGVRATNGEEGLLGIALAPDFATSKLVYVYLATTDENANQHVRVYRETAPGVGTYVGTVQTSLEPPAESANRNGGGLAFGVDGCLYVGVGDNGGRWNAQVLAGTDAVGGTEATQLCTDVCLNGAELPARTVATDGLANRAGKVLRLAVEGDSPAQPAPGGTLAAQPAAFTTGLRNPVAMTVHPLTGQVYVAERGDTQQAEIDVADAGSDQGWPCLEGTVTSSASQAACLTGHTAADVTNVHPVWRQPIVVHPGTPPPTPTGLTTYTGLAYPADYYGDVFYLLRDSARIYRIDLQPPCFLPPPGGTAPLAFHDTTNDGDFTVTYDADGDGVYDTVSFTRLVAIAQAPDRFGQSVLYVVGRRGTGITDASMIFRLEYATDFTPYAGPTGRVDDACFTGGIYSGTSLAPVAYGYDDPFLRPTCFPAGGPCPGQPDGTPCGDGDPCNGSETCVGGICQWGAVPADGTTACGNATACRDAGTCVAGACAPGTAKPDGTSCSDGEPCNGVETCSGGECRAGAGAARLTLHRLALRIAGGVLALDAAVTPSQPLAPDTVDRFTLRLDSPDVGFAATLDHPDSDAGWSHTRNRVRYVDRGRARSPLTHVVGRNGRTATELGVAARGVALPGAPWTHAAIVVGNQCFAADVTCTIGRRKVRCR